MVLAQGVLAGRSAGEGATSVSGIGGAIRSILDDAKRKGLIQFQQDASIAGAKDLFQFKKENTPPRNVFQVGKKGLKNVGQVGAEDIVRNEPSEGGGLFGDLAKVMALAAGGDPNALFQGIDGAGGAQPLQFNTEEELNAAIAAGQVKRGDTVFVNGVEGTAE